MKKIVFFLLLTLTVLLGFSQSSFRQTASNPTGAITNTSVDTVTYTLLRAYRLVSIQVTVTRLTGTMAGTAQLAYSVDGTTYVNTGTALTLTNAATNTTIWDITSAARYFRIITGGATTVTATVSAKVTAN